MQGLRQLASGQATSNQLAGLLKLPNSKLLLEVALASAATTMMEQLSSKLDGVVSMVQELHKALKVRQRLFMSGHVHDGKLQQTIKQTRRGMKNK